MENVISNVTEKENLIKMNIQLLAGEDSSADAGNEDPAGDDNIQTDANNGQNDNQAEKMISQAQLEDIINKKHAQWVKKTEREKEKAIQDAKEADKLEKMSASERYEKKLADLEKKLEEKEKAEARKDLTNTTLKELSVRNIDSDFLEFVLGENAEDTKQKLDLFETKVNSMIEARVNAQVQDRLKGNSPKVSTSQTKSSFTVEDIKNMSTSEINRNWEQIKNIKLN